MHPTSKAIGILGGTFDPIHIGHMRLAIEFQSIFEFSSIRLIPCFQPVHRAMPQASAKERLEMIKLAIADFPFLSVDPREIERQGPSYMIDTLLSLRQEMPETPLCLLLGLDAFLELTTWHRYEEIVNVAHVIVAQRPPYTLPSSGIFADMIKERFQQDIHYVHDTLAGGILLSPMTPLSISASEIRKQIVMEQNPRYLLPDSVYAYIKQHGIYQSSQNRRVEK